MPARFALVLALALAACSSTEPAEPAAAPEPASTEAVPITTTSPEALDLYLSGRTKMERFHPEEARKELLAAVSLDPDFAMAWLTLSWAAPSREDMENALARAEAAAPAVTEPERDYVHAAMASHAGRLEQAREHLEKILARYAGDPRAHYQLAMNYWGSDDPATLDHLRRAVELDPGFDLGWNMLGYASAHFGKLPDAVEAHRRYVALLPDEPNAHDSFAETLLRAGRYEESIAEYERALALDPSFVWSRLGIGHNYVFLRRYERARNAYEKAMADARTPQDMLTANQWLTVLGIYAALPADALSAAERGVTLAAGVGDYEAALALRTLARVHLHAGDAKKAREIAGQALARLGEDATASTHRELMHGVLRLLAEIDLAENDAEAAVRRVAELTELSKSLWEVRLTAFTEGLVALHRGDARAALGAFERAPIEGDPRYLYHLALARLRVGEREEALRLFEEVVAYNSPSFGHALVFAPARSQAAVLRFR